MSSTGFGKKVICESNVLRVPVDSSMVIFTGENGSAGGAANRIRNEAAVEPYAFLSNAIDMRRAIHFAAIRANRLIRVIVRHNE